MCEWADGEKDRPDTECAEEGTKFTVRNEVDSRDGISIVELGVGAGD